MKILSVGDIHGKSVWRNIDPTKYDRIYFMGDLYDAFEYTNAEIHTNALELVHWAQQACNVQFVIGNHDAHYFTWHTPVFKQVRGSGYSAKQLYRAYNLYHENKDLFKIAYRQGKYLWTHAGLSDSSYNLYFKSHVSSIMTMKGFNNLVQVLNYLWDIKDPSIFHIPQSRGGSTLHGSLLWADITDTWGSPLEGYHQIVGHSKVDDITHKHLNNDTSITYIDCLNKKIGKFYEIDI
jgi:predicted phosphodiesterase